MPGRPKVNSAKTQPLGPVISQGILKKIITEEIRHFAPGQTHFLVAAPLS